jgi:lia operon protein LiaG
MKSQNRFAKVFLAVTLFTVAAFAFAATLAIVSGATPKGVLAKLQAGLNKDEKTIHDIQDYAVEDVKKINVESGSTDIELVPGASATAGFALEGRAGGDTKMEITREGDAINVKIKRSKKMHWTFDSGFGLSTSQLHLRVALPKAYHGDMHVEVGSGDLTADDLTLNDVDLKSGSGDVKVTQVSAKNMNASSGSGDQNFSGKIEQLTARTGSGGMSLHNLIGKSLTVSTGSGELSISDIQAQVASAKTGSGSAAVKLGDLARWTATARTGSGGIRGDLAKDLRKSERHEFTVGHGADQLNVETGSGDVEINL